MTFLQKMAATALASLIALIFVGAVVRVTGAGLGCPDWPTCWGCIIPPWKKEQVDPSRINFEKFRHAAERLHRDPATVTPDHVLESFNPVHTWTEFINRLCSLPLGLSTLIMTVVAAGHSRRWPWVAAAATASLILVIAAALFGKWIVESGLKPGIITTHLAIAMSILGLLAYIAWRATPRPWLIQRDPASLGTLRYSIALLLLLIVAEGIMGSQIREKTDVLALAHKGLDRSAWIGELESATIYLVHRSFSWAILLAAAWAWRFARRGGPAGRVANTVMGLVLAQMFLGVIMSQFHIFAVVQVLHVGFSGCLIATTTLWLCGTFQVRTATEKLSPAPAATAS